MLKYLVRIVSFFAKEVNSVRRQPLLLGGLILGPFLILSLFGVGYTGERPVLRTALVVPPGRKDDPQLRQMMDNMGTTFQVDAERHIYESEEPALAALKNDEVDVVEVFPLETTDVFSTGQAVDIRITYNQIDPLLRDWIEYLSYTQINELNKVLLQTFVGSSQQQVGTLREYVTDARTQVTDVRTQLNANNREQARATVQQLRESGSGQLLALALLQNQSGDASQSTANLSAIQANLEALERDLAAGGTVEQQETRLAEIDTSLGELDTVAERVQTIDPSVVVSPLRSKTSNLAPIGNLGDPNTDPATAYVRFYTPAVLALLLQHMMVTLAALSLVREQMQGTIEMFRVSPLSAIQVLIGKYLGYTLLAALILAVLMPLMIYGLGVPFPLAQLGPFALISLLVTLASLGWGFLISAVVNTDSQAVQFSMLMLLMSVFFSGFFIPLKSFISFIGYISNALPVTHGIQSYQQLLLLNQAPPITVYVWLIGIALVSFLLSWFIFRRQFQRK